MSEHTKGTRQVIGTIDSVVEICTWCGERWPCRGSLQEQIRASEAARAAEGKMREQCADDLIRVIARAEAAEQARDAALERVGVLAGLLSESLKEIPSGRNDHLDGLLDRIEAALKW